MLHPSFATKHVGVSRACQRTQTSVLPTSAVSVEMHRRACLHIRALAHSFMPRRKRSMDAHRAPISTIHMQRFALSASPILLMRACAGLSNAVSASYSVPNIYGSPNE